MNKNSVDYSIYLCTDRPLLQGRDLFSAVEEAILGGVTIVQLREKHASSLEFFDIARKMKELTARYNIPLIINDRLDIMLAVDADGLHIGQEDLPLPVARKLIGPNKILGWSVRNPDEAGCGQKMGADYLGAGSVFPTSTKPDAGEAFGLKQLQEIKNSVNIPVVGIGGINEENITAVRKTGIDGAAVISAVLTKQDIRKSSLRLKNLWTGKTV